MAGWLSTPIAGAAHYLPGRTVPGIAAGRHTALPHTWDMPCDCQAMPGSLGVVQRAGTEQHLAGSGQSNAWCGGSRTVSGVDRPVLPCERLAHAALVTAPARACSCVSVTLKCPYRSLWWSHLVA